MNFYKNKKTIISFSVAFITLAILSSCNFFESEYPNNIKKEDLPKWTISVNEIVKYPRASIGEQEVPSFKGEKIWVRKHYEINSRSIEKITMVPSKEKFDSYNLLLKLNHHGALIAMRLSNDTAHPPWAFLIDGVYYGSVKFEVTKQNEYDEVLVAGNFDKNVSEKIMFYSEANFKFLNPKDK